MNTDNTGSEEKPQGLTNKQYKAVMFIAWIVFAFLIGYAFAQKITYDKVAEFYVQKYKDAIIIEPNYAKPNQQLPVIDWNITSLNQS